MNKQLRDQEIERKHDGAMMSYFDAVNRRFIHYPLGVTKKPPSVFKNLAHSATMRYVFFIAGSGFSFMRKIYAIIKDRF